jgi:hypothetical protein
MKKYLFVAAAALCMAGPARAFNPLDEEEACMRYGTTSSSCQFYRAQQDQENRLQRLEQEQHRYQQNCSMFGRC